jgi:hypothetical protein
MAPELQDRYQDEDDNQGDSGEQGLGGRVYYQTYQCLGKLWEAKMRGTDKGEQRNESQCCDSDDHAFLRPGRKNQTGGSNGADNGSSGNPNRSILGMISFSRLPEMPRKFGRINRDDEDLNPFHNRLKMGQWLCRLESQV